MNAAEILASLDRMGYEAARLLAGVLWQSTLLFAAITVVVWVLRRKSPALRHALWAAAICAAPFLPLLAAGFSKAQAPQAAVRVLPEYEPPAEAATVLPAPVELAAPQDIAPMVPVAPAPGAAPGEIGLMDFPWATLLLAYTAGVAAFLLWVVLGHIRIRAWMGGAAPPDGGRIAAAFAASAATLGVRGRFRVLESPLVPAPFSAGVFRPAVLLPEGFAEGLSDGELAAVALHETAHILRRDALVLSLLALVRAVLFFHPLVWFAARRASFLAEEAADDAVLRARLEPLAYARTLVRIAEGLRGPVVSAEVAAGIVLSRGTFLRRVEAILSDKRDRMRKTSSLIFAGAAAAAVISLALAVAAPLGDKARPALSSTDATLRPAAGENEGLDRDGDLSLDHFIGRYAKAESPEEPFWQITKKDSVYLESEIHKDHLGPTKPMAVTDKGLEFSDLTERFIFRYDDARKAYYLDVESSKDGKLEVSWRLVKLAEAKPGLPAGYRIEPVDEETLRSIVENEKELGGSPTGQMVLRLFRADGKPLPEQATLVITGKPQMTWPQWEIPSDGKVNVPHCSAGSVLVYVFAEGCNPTVAGPFNVPEHAVLVGPEINLTAAAPVTVSMSAADGRRPASGFVEVYWATTSDETGLRRNGSLIWRVPITDKGEAVIPARPDFPVHVQCIPDGYEYTVIEHTRLTADALDVRLEPTEASRLRLADDVTGEPVEGAKVEFYHIRSPRDAEGTPIYVSGGATLGGDEEITTKPFSDEKGNVTLGSLRGGLWRYWLGITAEGYAPRIEGPVRAGDDLGEIRLGPPIVVSGEIVAPPEVLVAVKVTGSNSWSCWNESRDPLASMYWNFDVPTTRKAADRRAFSVPGQDGPALHPGVVRLTVDFGALGKQVFSCFTSESVSEVVITPEGTSRKGLSFRKAAPLAATSDSLVRPPQSRNKDANARAKLLVSQLADAAADAVVIRYKLIARKAKDSDVPAAAQKAGESPKLESRAWYLLRQIDADELLHALVKRLSPLYSSADRKGLVWDGVPAGGTLELAVATEGDVPGEILVGLFQDAKWSGVPVQVRAFRGPGKYEITGVPPGAYQVGAIAALIGGRAKALGVQRDWPAPVEIRAGERASAEILVSTAFEGAGTNPNLSEEAVDVAKMDKSRLVKVRAVDAKSDPIPYCRITFVDRGPRLRYYEPVTDEEGWAYCDSIFGPLSVWSAWYETTPEFLGTRYQFKRLTEIYNAQENPVITFRWEPFPVGTGTVRGAVADQFGKPLTGYTLTLTQEKGERISLEEYSSFSLSRPVIDPEGRYEVSNLPSGKYKVMVRSFDVVAYVWDFDMGRFVIPEGDSASVNFDLLVDARDFYYGRLAWDDGTPVPNGYWKVLFEDIPYENYFCMSADRDGLFRVSLSGKERDDILKNQQGMVEVGCWKPDVTSEIHIDRFSRDKANPTTVTLPRPTGPENTAPDGTKPSAASGAPSQSGAEEPKAEAKELVSQLADAERRKDVFFKLMALQDSIGRSSKIVDRVLGEGKLAETGALVIEKSGQYEVPPACFGGDGAGMVVVGFRARFPHAGGGSIMLPMSFVFDHDGLLIEALSGQDVADARSGGDETLWFITKESYSPPTYWHLANVYRVYRTDGTAVEMQLAVRTGLQSRLVLGDWGKGRVTVEVTDAAGADLSGIYEYDFARGAFKGPMGDAVSRCQVLPGSRYDAEGQSGSNEARLLSECARLLDDRVGAVSRDAMGEFLAALSLDPELAAKLSDQLAGFMASTAHNGQALPALAAGILCELRDTQTLGCLEQVAFDSECWPPVQANALLALGRMGDGTRLDELRALAERTAPDRQLVRLAAIRALAFLAGDAAVTAADKEPGGVLNAGANGAALAWWAARADTPAR